MTREEHKKYFRIAVGLMQRDGLDFWELAEAAAWGVHSHGGDLDISTAIELSHELEVQPAKRTRADRMVFWSWIIRRIDGELHLNTWERLTIEQHPALSSSQFLRDENVRLLDLRSWAEHRFKLALEGRW